MCGIAGYIGKKRVSDTAVEACLGRMQRRGPDDSAVRRFEAGDSQVVLLHSRLSIFDLDPRSNQPMTVGKMTGIFNGAIYNFVELKQELAAAGSRFETTSDTEVLLALLDRDGWPALDRAEGMWALAVWDAQSRSLTLTRDRFAEKPLYVFRTPDGIYFGSEAKFIFALMQTRPPVNHDQLRRFIVNGYRSIYKTGQQFYEGLDEIQPGTTLTIGADLRERKQRYWTPQYRPDPAMTYDDAVAGVRRQLIESVGLRLRGDVPLAYLLSGGVDSNAIVGIARKHFNRDVHAYTVVNADERYDEKTMVESAVRDLGIRHTAIPVTAADFLGQLEKLINYHDAPIFTITYYVQWLLMKQVAADGYRIALSGTGADELLTGYYDYFLLHLAELKGTPDYADALAGWRKQVQPEVRNPYLSNPDLFVDTPDSRDYIYLKNDEFEQYLRTPFHEDFTEEKFSDSMLRNRMMNELFVEGVRVSLHEDDLNSMYFSVENRAPFLDRRLFEFCYTIPNRHLIRNGFNKAVLRDAMRGLAVDRVLDSPRKIGFNAPVMSFLDPNDPAVRDRLLADGPVFDIIRRDRIEDMLSKTELLNSESKFLFNFVNVRLFMDSAP
jgi:asparagine synthase (glutamine-hydrolysing)